MNTVSLVLTGRTTAFDMGQQLLQERPRSTSITNAIRPALSRAMSSFTSAPKSATHFSSRPSSSRRSSRDSTSSSSTSGWYNTENNLTLEDFAEQLNTRWKRFEIWQGRCAQSAVMALLRPTPLVLFVFNPVCLMVWMVVGLWWWAAR